MASALARLSPAGRAAAADAQPEAAGHRRARSAGHGDQPGRRSAGSTGTRAGSGARWAARPARSTRRHRDALARAIADHEVAPQMSYHERNARSDRAARRSARADLARCCSCRRSSCRSPRSSGSRWARPSSTPTAIGSRSFRPAFRRSPPLCSGSASRAILAATRCGRRRPPTRSGRSTANCADHVILSRAADLTEQAARSMLSDLDEWRLVNQQRDLSVG